MANIQFARKISELNLHSTTIHDKSVFPFALASGTNSLTFQTKGLRWETVKAQMIPTIETVVDELSIVKPEDPSEGTYLKYSLGSWKPAFLSVTLQGEVTGATGSTTVSQLLGKSLPNSSDLNNVDSGVLRYNGTNWGVSTTLDLFNEAFTGFENTDSDFSFDGTGTALIPSTVDKGKGQGYFQLGNLKFLIYRWSLGALSPMGTVVVNTSTAGSTTVTLVDPIDDDATANAIKLFGQTVTAISANRLTLTLASGSGVTTINANTPSEDRIVPYTETTAAAWTAVSGNTYMRTYNVDLKNLLFDKIYNIQLTGGKSSPTSNYIYSFSCDSISRPTSTTTRFVIRVTCNTAFTTAPEPDNFHLFVVGS